MRIFSRRVSRTQQAAGARIGLLAGEPLLQVKAPRCRAWNVRIMDQHEPVTVIATQTACCLGSAAGSHEAIEIVLSALTVTKCPRCGRQFRRADPSGTVSPAVWPKEE